MTLRLHVQIVGALLLSLGLLHAFFNRYFGWDKELASISVLTRRIFFVHSFFIGLSLVMMGAGSIFCVDALLQPSQLSRVLLAGLAVFWSCRLVTQLFVYEPAIWRGRGFYTVMHVAFSILWVYVVAVYGLALRAVLR